MAYLRRHDLLGRCDAFININSHGTQKSIDGFDAFLLNPSSPDIIDAVLELVRKEDLDHYNLFIASRN